MQNIFIQRAQSLGQRLFSTMVNDKTRLYELGGLRVFETHDPNFARDVLKHHHNMPMPSFVRASLRELIGKSLIVDEGESWAMAHSALKSLFSKDAVGHKIAPIAASQCAEMIERWLSAPGPVDIEREMRDVTGRTIMKVMFGDSITTQQAQRVIKAASVDIETFNPTAPNILLSAAARVLGRPYDSVARPKGAIKDALNAANAVYQDIIDARRPLPRQPADVLGVLLEMKTPEGAPLTDTQVKDQLRMFVFAGHETTAVTITNAVQALLRPANAGVLSALRQQLSSTLGARDVQGEDARSLPYARNIILESLRFEPPAARIAREAQGQQPLKTIPLQDKDIVWIDVRAMHHAPSLWDRPEEFQPDRFIPSQNPNAFLPFGAGGRQCLGRLMAETESVIILSGIFNKVALTPVENLQGHINGITRRPAGHLRARVSPLR